MKADSTRLQHACINNEPPLLLSHFGSFAEVLGESDGAPRVQFNYGHLNTATGRSTRSEFKAAEQPGNNVPFGIVLFRGGRRFLSFKRCLNSFNVKNSNLEKVFPVYSKQRSANSLSKAWTEKSPLPAENSCFRR